VRELKKLYTIGPIVFWDTAFLLIYTPGFGNKKWEKRKKEKKKRKKEQEILVYAGF
jgi:hypothetical protein